MAVRPIEARDIKSYFQSSVNEIFHHFCEFHGLDDSSFCVNGIKYCSASEMLAWDRDGYLVSGVIRYGNYNPHNTVISINCEELAKKVSWLKNNFINNNTCISQAEEIALSICDLIFLHELSHMYQDKVEHKTMQRGDRNLEDEANDMAKTVFESYSELNDRCRNEVEEAALGNYSIYD